MGERAGRGAVEKRVFEVGRWVGEESVRGGELTGSEENKATKEKGKR